MIEFRPLTFSSMLHLTEILSELEVTAFDFSTLEYEKLHSFVVIEGSETVGICLYSFLSTDSAVVKLIFIKPSIRNIKLGDGLLRASLNSIEIHGGTHVIFEGNLVEQSFYLHEGMKRLSDVFNTENAPEYNYLEDRYYAYCSSIFDFFNKPCKGHIKQ